MSLSHGLYNFVSNMLVGKSISSTANSISAHSIEFIDEDTHKIIFGKRFFKGKYYDTIEFVWISKDIPKEDRYEIYNKYKDRFIGKIFFQSKSKYFRNHSKRLFGNIYKYIG